MSPERTASTPFAAMPSILTNHWLEIIGSITSPPRCEMGTRLSRMGTSTSLPIKCV